MTQKKQVKKPAAKKPAAKKLNATQKINMLEQSVDFLNQKIMVLADELDRMGQITQGLARRLNAAVTAGEQGDLSNDAIQSILVDQNVKELEAQVTQLVENKVLESTEDGISAKTFVVGRELDEDGKVANPRAQFAFETIKDPEIISKFEDKKVGDVVKPNEGALSFEILEVYAIQDPKEKTVDFESEGEAVIKEAEEVVEELEEAVKEAEEKTE